MTMGTDEVGGGEDALSFLRTAAQTRQVRPQLRDLGGGRERYFLKIRERPDVPRQDFLIFYRRSVTWRLMGETKILLVKQLEYENANASCQTTIFPKMAICKEILMITTTSV